MTDCLLVIDVQRDVIAPCWEAEAITHRIAALVDRARARRIAVVWVQHEEPGLVAGTPGWELAAPLAPAVGEPIVAKRYRDAFADTDLSDLLRERDVDRLYVVGAQSDYCVRTTLQRAVQEGFDVVLVSDAHTTTDAETPLGRVAARDIVGHVTLYASGLRYPAARCRVLPAAEAFGGEP